MVKAQQHEVDYSRQTRMDSTSLPVKLIDYSI